MAEVDISTTNKHPKTRSRKRSTKVDLTPMVDLGFLLITFFIFTTSMTEPKALKLNLPEDKTTANPPTTAEGKTLTMIAGGDNKVYYYMGSNISSMTETTFGPNSLRKQIIKKQRQVANKYHDPKELMILLKPTTQSTYQNIVDLLDEMLISGVTRYMLTDPNVAELKELEHFHK